MYLPILPPLSLYLHIPWCVRKCPYCDFNSHAAGAEIQERLYVDALLADLEVDLDRVQGRPLTSIFIGGGTPSLFSAEAIGRLLEGVRERVGWEAGCEVTMEANPGSVEAGRFREFAAAGVNRLSIGIQSFEDPKLQALGRIHDRAQAIRAAETAREAGFERLNLDLMYGLPGQTVGQAMADLDEAVRITPDHLSWYQLTLEPNTHFQHAPPPGMPDDERLGEIEEAGLARLEEAGYRRYEVSAFARPGNECRHNLNYWTFGDYLGIGAGAHGKLSSHDRVERRARRKGPDDFLRHAGTEAAVVERRRLTGDDLLFEFMLNALRLVAGFERPLFAGRTGLSDDRLGSPLARARELGLIAADDRRIAPTPLGLRYLNDLQQLFLDEGGA